MPKLAAILSFLATPILAQTAREVSATLLVEDGVASGVPTNLAEAMVPCFMENLSDAQVEALLNAPDAAARDSVLSRLENLEELEACSHAAMDEVQ